MLQLEFALQMVMCTVMVPNGHKELHLKGQSPDRPPTKPSLEGFQRCDCDSYLTGLSMTATYRRQNKTPITGPITFFFSIFYPLFAMPLAFFILSLPSAVMPMGLGYNALPSRITQSQVAGPGAHRWGRMASRQSQVTSAGKPRCLWWLRSQLDPGARQT